MSSLCIRTDTRYTRIACYIAYTVQAVVNNFLPLLFVTFNRHYGVSLSRLSFLISLNFGLQFIIDIGSIGIVRKIGTRRSVVYAQALCTVGLISLALLPNVMKNVFPALCISTVMCSLGSGLIEVLISPIITRSSQTLGRKYMSIAHSFYCWGQIIVVAVTTVIIKIFGAEYWQYISLFWAVVPFVNIFMFSVVPIAEEPQKEQRTPLGKIVKTPAFMLFAVLMVVAGASELAMSQWASTFAEEGLNLDKFTGDLLGPCAFAFFMGTGRILYSLFSEKIGIYKVFAVCSIGTLMCYLCCAFVKIPLVAVFACAFCGMGVSVLWPGVYAMAPERFPNGGNAMFGVLAMFGDIGCTSGPLLAGIVADRFSLRSGMLAAAVFPLIAITALFINKIKLSGRKL